MAGDSLFHGPVSAACKQSNYGLKCLREIFMDDYIPARARAATALDREGPSARPARPHVPVQARRATAPDRKGLSGPALRTFFRIAELWSLSVDEQMTLLGLSARSTFFKWKRDSKVVLPRDTLERISYVVGIYKALQVLLPDQKAADEWVKRPNSAHLFGGRSALDRMLSGQVADLFLVRQYVDSECGT